MANNYSVYTLSDPRNGEVRYVGCSMHPYVRYGQHLSLTGANFKKSNWIKELAALQIMPTLTIVETLLSREEAMKRETHWIRCYSESGAELTNAHQHMPSDEMMKQAFNREVHKLAEENGWSIDTAYSKLVSAR